MFLSAPAFSQVASKLAQTPNPNEKLYTVEATCGECNYGMEGDDCDLAIKFKGKTYFVDGVSITEYGHPHDKGGFCVAIRKAEVQGTVENGRFKATYFKLLSDKSKQTKKN